MKAMETKEYSKMSTELAELLYEERHHSYQLASRCDTSDWYYPPLE